MPSALNRSNTRWAAPGSLRSSATVCTVTLRLSSSAADSSVRSFRPTKIRLCSSAAACRASSSPMPLLAPVISVKTDDWLRICVILRQHQDNDKIKFAAASNATPRQSGAASTLHLGVELRALLLELASFLFQADLERLLFRNFLLGSKFPDVFGNFHRTKVRTAHGTEVCGLGAFLRQGLIVELARGLWIQGEIELIFPAKFEARF